MAPSLNLNHWVSIIMCALLIEAIMVGVVGVVTYGLYRLSKKMITSSNKQSVPPTRKAIRK